MWTSTLDLDPKRVLVTHLLGHIWRGAYFSSFAPLQVQNLPRQPLPKTTWVRVRNRLAGICGSDLHMIQTDGDLRIAPATIPQQRHSYPGHEVIGEVLEIGEDVRQLRVGDRVVLQYGSNCHSTGVQPLCHSCAQGNYNLCEHSKLPGPYPIGGGWSEEMLLHEQQLFRIPADISDDQAVLLEPASVAVHAVLRSLPAQGDRVLIIGAGTIGLLTLQIVRALVPQAEISVLARHPFQIEQATRLGAAHIIYPQDSYAGIQRATGAQMHEGILGNRLLQGGYDVVFDTVGSQKTLHHALRWARAQSTIILVGLSLHMMHIDLTPIWYREINLFGSLGSGREIWPLSTREQRSTFEVTTELIKRRQIHPEHLITHRFPLTNYQVAVRTAIEKAQNRAIKVIFDYSLLPPSVVPNVRASAARLHKAAPNRPLLESEEEPYPIEALASSVSVKQPTSIDSSSDPMPEMQNDEIDEMEDTIKVPAIAKHTGPVQAHTKTITQQANEPEDKEIMPINDSDREEAPILQFDDPSTNYELSTELSSKEPVVAFTPAETYEDSLQNSHEPSESVVETVRTSYDETEYFEQPDVVAQEAFDETEYFEQPDVMAQEAFEASTLLINETSQDTYQDFESSDVTIQNISEPSQSLTVEETQTVSELLEQLPHASEELEQTTSTMMQDTSEHSELSTDVVQQESIATDMVQEGESEGFVATNDTENALLQVEATRVVPLQSRPRTRARKKSGRGTGSK